MGRVAVLYVVVILNARKPLDSPREDGTRIAISPSYMDYRSQYSPRIFRFSLTLSAQQLRSMD